MTYLVPVLIWCWLVLAIRCCVQFGTSGTDRSNAIRATGQRFYELLMYPNGRVTIRRVSCNSNNVENGGACQRWGGGVSGAFGAGFTYNSNNNPHKFWMSFDRGSGRCADLTSCNWPCNWLDV